MLRDQIWEVRSYSWSCPGVVSHCVSISNWGISSDVEVISELWNTNYAPVAPRNPGSWIRSYCVQYSVIVKQRPCCNFEFVRLTIKYNLYSLIEADTELGCDFVSPDLYIQLSLRHQPCSFHRCLWAAAVRRDVPGVLCRGWGSSHALILQEGHEDMGTVSSQLHSF